MCVHYIIVKLLLMASRLQEAISLEMPYYNHRVEASVIMSILNRKLPTQPQHSDDIGWNVAILWPFCLECWRYNPSDRPTMTDVTERLQVCQPMALDLYVFVAEMQSLGLRFHCKSEEQAEMRRFVWTG